MLPRTVLFDFDGVLSRGRFYRATGWAASLYERVQAHIFGGEGDLVRPWMRGRVGYRELHARIAGAVGIAAEVLDRMLIESVRSFRLEPSVLRFAERLKAEGCRIGLVTDNMDIFAQVTVPHFGLGYLFDAIVSSSEYGLLKRDDGGKLFDIALRHLGERDIRRSMLIDDALPNIELFRAKGGQGHHFTGTLPT